MKNEEVEDKLGPVMYIGNKIKEQPIVVFDFHNMLDKTNDLFLKTNLMIDYEKFKDNNKFLREKRVNILHFKRVLREYISENFRLLRFYSPAYLLVQYVGGEEMYEESRHLDRILDGAEAKEKILQRNHIFLSLSIPMEYRKINPL